MNTTTTPPGSGNDGKPLDLTSIGMLVTALIGLLGALTLTGTVGRVQRNHPTMFTIAIVALVLAAALWVLANTVPKGTKRAHVPLGGLVKVVAGLIAVAGYGIALAITIATANDEPRPHITTTISGHASKLEATVSASGLPVKDRLAIHVDLLERKENPRPGQSLFLDRTQPVYQAYIGPDADGNVNQSLAIPLPGEGRFTDVSVKAYTGTSSPQCDDLSVPANPQSPAQVTGYKGSGTGCVIVALHPGRLATGAGVDLRSGAYRCSSGNRYVRCRALRK